MLKVIERKLTSTRGRVSRTWASYRTKKKHVLGLKRITVAEKKQIISSELDLTRQKISATWTGYRERKYAIVHHSPYEGFSLVRQLTGVKKTVNGKDIFFRFKSSYQKIYKARKRYNPDNLDSVVPAILEERHVEGVLVVFEVTSEESGQTQHVSNYINAEVMKRIRAKGETVYEYIVEKFRAGSTKDYKLHLIYIRVIYAKS